MLRTEKFMDRLEELRTDNARLTALVNELEKRLEEEADMHFDALDIMDTLRSDNARLTVGLEKLEELNDQLLDENDMLKTANGRSMGEADILRGDNAEQAVEIERLREDNQILKESKYCQVICEDDEKHKAVVAKLERVRDIVGPIAKKKRKHNMDEGAAEWNAQVMLARAIRDAMLDEKARSDE